MSIAIHFRVFPCFHIVREYIRAYQKSSAGCPRLTIPYNISFASRYVCTAKWFFAIWPPTTKRPVWSFYLLVVLKPFKPLSSCTGINWSIFSSSMARKKGGDMDTSIFLLSSNSMLRVPRSLPMGWPLLAIPMSPSGKPSRYGHLGSSDEVLPEVFNLPHSMDVFTQ